MENPMKKETQAGINLFPYSDSNKRYHTFEYYLRQRFGEKCARISLDAGLTCPNIDGTCGMGGCIYCLNGSGAAQGGATLAEQYAAGIAAMQKKWKCSKYIPYLQAHTNTYAPAKTLRCIYKEASRLPGAVMLAIATRPDCLDPEVVSVLAETSRSIPLLVELGLQTIHDDTASRINRGHSYSVFADGYRRLRNAGGDISICIHLINGLPGETKEHMIASARAVAALEPDMVKLHLLHVLRGTPLHKLYLQGAYTPMEQAAYVNIVCDQLECFPPQTVVARVTGDAPADVLAAPLWSRRKTAVSNDIDKELYRRKSFQGMQFSP